MFRQWLGMHDSVLPLVALLLFVGIGVLVTLYIATDRRQEHRRRMERLALGEEETHG